MADIIVTGTSGYATGAIDTASTVVNSVTATDAVQPNGLAAAVIQLETVLGLGTTLKGSGADLAARLAVALAANGTLNSGLALVSPAISGTSTIGAGMTITTPALTNPSIAGTVTGNASYTTPTLTSPGITGTVTGGASYSSPTITGTVAGNASYTAPILTGVSRIGVRGILTGTDRVSVPDAVSTVIFTDSIVGGVTGTTFLVLVSGYFTATPSAASFCDLVLFLSGTPNTFTVLHSMDRAGATTRTYSTGTNTLLLRQQGSAGAMNISTIVLGCPT